MSELVSERQTDRQRQTYRQTEIERSGERMRKTDRQRQRGVERERKCVCVWGGCTKVIYLDIMRIALHCYIMP